MGKRGAKFRPTDVQRAEVLKRAIDGCPQEVIAGILDIDVDTLKKYFKDELKKGKALCAGDFIGKLKKMGVVEGIPSAVIFYLKTQCGYREKDPQPQEPTRTNLIFNKGETRHSKQVLPDKKEGTND